MADKQSPRTAPVGVDTSIPSSARIWNYWMGGKDNYPVDRVAGDEFAATYPGIIPLAKASRGFLIRAVSHLAGEAGIRQFLDIGTGLPTMENTHEVAQRAAPQSRIVYVDNDPMVLVHARALLVNTTAEGVTTYVDGDFHDPAQIVADARNVLNFNEPIAVMFMGVLGHVTNIDEVRTIVGHVVDAVPSGSHLVLWDGADNTEQVEATDDYAETGAVPYNPRSVDQIRSCFDGLQLLEPGVASISQWRPDTTDAGMPEPVDGFGGVARKP